jgi:CopG family nickel-responsive transcriptional regulator
MLNSVMFMSEDETIRISMSLSKSLLEDFDKVIEEAGYEDRSKAIRAAIHNFITESKWLHRKGSEVAGVLAMVYDHKTRGLDNSLIDIQHHHEDVIRSTMHIHLDKRNCLQIIAVKGEAEEIKELSKELTIRGVKQIKRVVMTTS